MRPMSPPRCACRIPGASAKARRANGGVLLALAVWQLSFVKRPFELEE